MKSSIYTAALAILLGSISLNAQTNEKKALTIGGYGEIAMTRNFYTDSPYIYAKPENYKDAPGHGRFDIPHATFAIGYDFGKGWTMQSEIEFEHLGTGATIEREYEEAGEFEQEIEKGTGVPGRYVFSFGFLPVVHHSGYDQLFLCPG